MSIPSDQIVIYLGPSLPVHEARALLDADYRPPIRRGDIFKMLQQGPRPKVIGIIDGRFFQSFAISPKEILLALEAGITVLGSSSMGALRAAELHTLEMIGVGTVFEMYRDEVLDADDEVALTFSEEEGTAMSVPLVNIRVALQHAVKEGIIPPETERGLVELTRSIYFPERSYGMMLKQAAGRFPEAQLRALGEYLRGGRAPDAKRDDAVKLLHEVKRLAQTGGSEARAASA
ncbi:TfuA-related McrA-glycine thioamidation protein [Archangium sp.]|uniref:TfuA-related McrA-glycine thioamidation protein n=1 Tax=Archangium sp. TaxID=1872627 RepID=UPI002D4DA832|nr:TfuA-related McrA-glycine thioamidation protein [Archangium sp.]HYO51406.1 TfuA-related McrA-glycine thioamidation protein [Archangium sp.]